MPRDAGGRGITIMEPDLLAGRKLTKVQALQSWSWLQLSASLLVGCRLGTCPISPSWALLLFPLEMWLQRGQDQQRSSSGQSPASFPWTNGA